MPRATTSSCAHSLQPTTLKQRFGHQTITVQDTTAPEFTFVPADYTVECSDEMPMDDATASDNCGEVTIEVSSETTAGDAAATTPSFAPSRPPTTRATALGHPDHHDPGHHCSEFTFVPADYTVECSDEMPMDDATASTTGRGDDRSVQRNRPAMPQATTPSFARSPDRRRWKQRFGHTDHHSPGHHSTGVLLRACRLHRRVLGRDANGRRCGVGQLR